MYLQEPSLKLPTLADILESSKKLQHNLFQLELPQIQLGLDQIRRCSEEQALSLGLRDGDTKAHYLLAGSGMNAKETLQTLMSIQLVPFYESAPLMDTDIDVMRIGSWNGSRLSVCRVILDIRRRGISCWL